ncbi:phospholipase [Clavibacter michiganensis]|uniref:alpha/beta hydrolase n=1 Tax=Clavibacter michiganensis TaxID=28447 RepID=UPI000CE77FCD|nr:phospholipase [Clavibacter michiganensis]PPF56493.1 phospholipase [Clavibacter michiganensis]
MTEPTVEPQVWGDADPGDARALAVVALHGRTQDVTFVRGLSERLGVPGLRWFAPEAVGRSWYPHPFLDPAPDNAEHLGRALDAVEASVAAAHAAGFARVALLGFSQGACTLSHFLLTRDVPVVGAVLFTGGYVGADPLEPRTVAERVGSLRRGVPVLLRSIDHDPWVPAFRVADTARLLALAGAQADVLVEPGDEHGITERAAADARLLLHRLRDPEEETP